MIMKVFNALFLICFFYLLSSCAKQPQFNTTTEKGKVQKSRQSHRLLEELKKNSKIKAGDVIDLVYEFPNYSSRNVIRMFFDGHLVNSCNDKICRLSYSTQDESLGTHQLIVSISDTTGRKNIQIPIEIVSNIVPEFLKYEILNVYPHDANAFTQGLFFHDDVLYESTGMEGASSLRKVRLQTGEVIKKYILPESYFAEGIALSEEKIIQLTWKNHVGVVYSKESFEKLHEFHLPYEGWGITSYGNRFYLSDGSQNIYILDAVNYRELKRIQVYDDNGPIRGINELEYIKGTIFANIFATSKIAKIEAKTGKVLGWLNLKDIVSIEAPTSTNHVLNGIAYDKQNERFFVTGKNWTKLFAIKIH